MSKCNESTQAAIWSEAAGRERPAEPPREPVAKPPARFQAINREQMVFRPLDVEQLLVSLYEARSGGSEA